MDQTIRTPEQPNTTIRVAPLGKGAGDATYVTGRDKSATANAAGDFLIKGKVYHNLKCLSDNSGEAQVFWSSATRNRWC